MPQANPIPHPLGAFRESDCVGGLRRADARGAISHQTRQPKQRPRTSLRPSAFRNPQNEETAEAVSLFIWLGRGSAKW
jgi:hypothetical protein